MEMECIICHKWKRSPNYMCEHSTEENISKMITKGCFLFNILDGKSEYYLCNECHSKICEAIKNIRAIRLGWKLGTINRRGCCICFGSENLKRIRIYKNTYRYNIVKGLGNRDVLESTVIVCIACEEVTDDLVNLHKLAYGNQQSPDRNKDTKDSEET